MTLTEQNATEGKKDDEQKCTQKIRILPGPTKK